MSRDPIRERRAFEDLTPAGARRLRKAVDDPLSHEATEARLAAREADGVPAWMHGNAREQQLGAVADGLGLTTWLGCGPPTRTPTATRMTDSPSGSSRRSSGAR